MREATISSRPYRYDPENTPYDAFQVIIAPEDLRIGESSPSSPRWPWILGIIAGILVGGALGWVGKEKGLSVIEWVQEWVGREKKQPMRGIFVITTEGLPGERREMLSGKEAYIDLTGRIQKGKLPKGIQALATLTGPRCRVEPTSSGRDKIKIAGGSLAGPVSLKYQDTLEMEIGGKTQKWKYIS